MAGTGFLFFSRNFVLTSLIFTLPLLTTCTRSEIDSICKTSDKKQQNTENHLENTFNLLTYNTWGLPSTILSPMAPERFHRIGEIIEKGPYDIALLQEDFCWHSHMKEYLSKGTHITRGIGGLKSFVRRLFATTVRTFGLCDSNLASGLTTVSKTAKIVESSYQPFNICNGYFSDRSDCLATKGILSTLLHFPYSNFYIYVHNLHLDAGSGKDNIRAREKQIIVLEKWLRSFNNEIPHIIAGDFNYCFNGDRHYSDVIQGFKERLGIKYVYEVRMRGHKNALDRCTDHIFYRNGKVTELIIDSAGVAREFVDDEGNPLSDHAAFHARFKIKSNGLLNHD